MDRDNNGKVSLEEFSNMYFTEIIRLEEEVEEVRACTHVSGRVLTLVFKTDIQEDGIHRGFQRLAPPAC
jgi:hypothetical protein